MTDTHRHDCAPTPVSAGIDAFRRPGPPIPRTDVSRALDELPASADPSVVLAGLVRLSVAIGFADGGEVELTEGTRPPFRVSADSPSADAPSRGSTRPRTIATPVHGPSRGRFDAFSGVVVHWWHHRPPGEDERLVADLLVRHAVAVVDRQRLLDMVAEREEHSSQLTMQAITGRWLNVATGLLMAQLDVEADDAEETLRDAARERGTTVWDLALDVVRSGGLRDRDGSQAADAPDRRAPDGPASDRTSRGTLRSVRH